ncbi:MAG: dsDNA nuclease domain-containing protein [Candidatus Paceibacterota bacterium]
MSKINPTSSIRGGFDYQDWWGLKFCGDWLNSPSSYSQLQFETTPEEIGAERFYLDDIILTNAQKSYRLYQIKHRQKVENAWTWDDFLSSTGNRSSMIQKWEQSLNKLKPQAIECACLITNAIAGEDVANFLENGKINFTKLKEQNTDLYQKILNQLGSDERISNFFSSFNFKFKEPDFSELEEQVKNYFLNNLRATESGVNNLLLQIHKECRSNQTQPLSLEQLRLWCEFDDPQPLKEDFFIPEDFQFFDEQVHENIIKELNNPNGGIKIITGKPGTGKSVYLSKLYQVLSEQKIITIKHHYHLSPEDSNPQERLNSERVIEALKAQFKQYPDELGDLAYKNSENISPREYIDALASRMKTKKRTFVLIIDGLDHVIRNADKEELKKFLQNVCFPQPGLWIILGTQPGVSDCLSGIILDKCPSDTWIEMLGFNRDAVKKIINKNCINLNLPDNENGLPAFIEKTFKVTQGNQLHLRYLLSELKIKHNAGLVTEYAIDSIVPYGGDISNYYNALWKQLADKAKMVLFTLASVNFVFKRTQLLECVSSFENHPVDISQSFQSIQHLIREDRKNRLTVYHNSFQVFLLSQSTFEEQKITLKKNIEKWLETSSHETLKWAELRKIKYELGDSEPILELDRQWLLESISHPRNSYQINAQLILASQAAFEKDDFAKVLSLSHLRTYYLNSANFVEEGCQRIFSEAIQLNKEALDDVEIIYTSTPNLIVLASLANNRGDFTMIEEIIDELVDRQHGQEYRRKGDGSSMPSVSRALLKTIPYDRTHEVDRIYKYIKQFDDLGWTPDLFSIYSKQLLVLDQLEKTKKLLSFELTSAEKVAVLDQCIIYDLEHDANNFDEFYKQNSSLSVYVFQTFRGNFKGSLPILPSYDSLPTKVPEFSSSERQKWTDFFYDCFFTVLLYGLNGHEKDIEDWNNNGPDIWCAKALSAIFKATLRISNSIKKESRVNYEDLFAPFLELEKLQWPDDRDQLDLQVGLSRALSQALEIIFVIKRVLNNVEDINTDNLKIICSTPFYSENDLLEFLISKDKAILSNDAYRLFISQRISKAKDLVTYFPDRTVAYTDLASLARLQNDNKIAKELLLSASDNLLGYGYHKDVYLFEVLESIDFCGSFGTSKEKINTWIQRIGSIIESVTDYTDGDETNYLLLELAEILGKYNRPALYRDYYASANNEELFHAQDLFKRVISSMSYDKKEEIALGATAIDKENFGKLKIIAQENNGAKQSLRMITEYLGDINYPEEPKTPSSFTEKYKEADFSDVAPDQLETKLKELSFENIWSRHQYLQGWLSYWLKQDNKENVFRAMVPIVSNIGIHDISGELLDMLYPLAYEFSNEEAFEFLCRAQANDYGWSRYWTDKKKAQQRWLFLKEKYPDRYLEFFKKSIAFGNRSSDEIGHSIPLSRGVEFFLLFEDLKNAEVITEASINFSEQLMADIKLPLPVWETDFYKHSDITEVDLLIQRLLWPSPLVRGQAANALAWLFYQSEHREEIYKKYTDWIKKQSLESVVAVSMLPFFKTIQIKNKADLSYINFEEVIKSLPIGSVVIDKLIEELALEMNIKIKDIEFPRHMDINPCPEAYQINSFFQKHIKGFLAPIYHDRAKEIESRGGRDFIRQWAFTSEEIISANKIGLNADLGYFQGRDGGETLVGMSTKLSEAYRSAFIRVLQYFFKSGLIPEDFYLEYTYATIPIDLALWKVKPRRAPGWWPKLKVNNNPVLSQISLESPIESLINHFNSSCLLLAEGAITPSSGWDGNDAAYSFSLIGFAYQVSGCDIPTAEDVAAELIDAPSAGVLIPSKAKRPFNFIDNFPNFYPIRTEPRIIGDLTIYPLIIRVRDLTISLWQFFRDYHAFSLLAPNLQKGLSLRVEEDQIIYEKNNQGIVSISDWLEGLKERNDHDLPLPHGQFLEIKKDILQQYLNSKGLRLGYLLKTTYKHKEHKYSDVKNFEECKLINLSSIILPPPTRPVVND